MKTQQNLIQKNSNLENSSMSAISHGVLTRNEAYLMADVLNGLMWDPEDEHAVTLLIGKDHWREMAAPIETGPNGRLIIRGHIASGMECEVLDAINLDGQDVRWNVDDRKFLEKLRAMTPEQRLAIINTVRRAWEASDEAGEFERILLTLTSAETNLLSPLSA